MFVGECVRMTPNHFPRLFPRHWVVNQILWSVWDVALTANKLAPHAFVYFCCRGDHMLRSVSPRHPLTQQTFPCPCPDFRKTTWCLSGADLQNSLKLGDLKLLWACRHICPSFRLERKLTQPLGIEANLSREERETISLFCLRVSPGLSRGMYYL